ncbi:MULTISPECIES: zinc-dependent metalloprotease family protein [unclassified Nocardioides]|uniref:zinc-dependent metalloprotease family protein n=1 Tax=unclassified Nocardioides TaxID=2615069 RepID=UPI0006F5EE41|nr:MULTISPECIES: zinc-dependent metalloprotease family protein [unclassified Nocardioides]KQY56726.1 hypothetical protein ASD30_10455 [Nocardioides sp. Root140]KQZ67077.1 hypothetical protein ASD66_18980 [Nocardioides sp. Root151]KRF12848.1 hypothetical protein ASH02_15100 [Nocardioides sp. Soil796]
MLRTTTLTLTAVCALALGGLAAVPATGSTDGDHEFTSADGQRVDDSELSTAARLAGQATEEVKGLLTEDPAARLTAGDRLYYADTFEGSGEEAGNEPVARASAPLSQTFRLHSRPGSRRTIYLDFNGEQVCDSEWSDGLRPRCYDAAGFDTDGRSGFSAGELRAIQSTWRRTAEDYAPFQVDVTTELPDAGALTRSGSADATYGVHAVITRSTTVRNQVCGGPGCAGVAFVGVFPYAAANNARVFWVFPREVDNRPQQMGLVVAHEAGHTLGLSHDGKNGDAYYSGHGIWAPIMGSSMRPLTQWSRGEYTGATERENDLSVMRAYGAPYRADDHAYRLSRATVLRAGVARPGVIGKRNDTDVFRLRTTCRARLSVQVANAPYSPNLDVSLTLLNRSGRVLARRNPLSAASGSPTGLDATYLATRAAGTYYVRVDGVGARDPRSTGYSDYGSLGNYRVKFRSRCGVR